MNNGSMMASNGKRFYPLNLGTECLDITVIARALSRICRFGGHTREFYSVAQHSVHVSFLVPTQDALQALLHDAPEAYLGDIPRPLKKTPEFSAYREAEARAWNQISAYYSLAPVMSLYVHEADNVALATEIRDLMPPDDGYESYGEPDPARLRGLMPDAAEEEFLNRFLELAPTWTSP